MSLNEKMAIAIEAYAATETEDDLRVDALLGAEQIRKGGIWPDVKEGGVAEVSNKRYVVKIHLDGRVTRERKRSIAIPR